MNDHRESLHAPVNTKIETAARTDRDSGRTICQSTRKDPAPSIRAASSSSTGIASKNFFSTRTITGATSCGTMMSG
jgi:hypothetical protein